MNAIKQSYVLHRSLGQPPRKISHGKGVFLYDSDGREYLDACGGAAVSCLGHGDRDVADAIKQQLDAVAYVHSGFFTSDVTESLAEKLINLVGGNARAALFFGSGSEAMEAAFKMVRQYHLERGEPSRTHIISRTHSYHGATLGALGVGGLDGRKRHFKPWLMHRTCSHISPCYPYRFALQGESEEAYAIRLGNEFEAEILRVGAKNVAVFVAETIVGATLGTVPPVKGYFKRIREICDRYGIVLVLDEVMCGMGRSGQWLACHQEQIDPDIVCVAKGLGGGFQPIGAMIINKQIYRALETGSGAFLHGQTYMGHAAACAGSLAVVKKIIRHRLLENVRERGRQLKSVLENYFRNHPHIGDIRGRGLFCSIELVKDKATKKSFSPDFNIHQKIKAEAMNNGLLCYPGGGNLDGGTGDHVLLSPPFIIQSHQINDIVDRLGSSIKTVLQSL